MEKVYLGDSVYAEVRNGMIVLTTEDGVSVSNEICLEMYVYQALVRFVTDLTQSRES